MVKVEFDTDFTDNSEEVLAELELWAMRVLIIWDMKIKDYAQALVPAGTADSTGIEDCVGGALKGSISYVVDRASKTVTVGTALMYTIYVELSTGVFAKNGNGRKTPWVWRDKNGKYHFTGGFCNVHSIHLEFFCKE